jgi:ubiquitin-conjugating enzyme E2 Q
MSGVGNSNTRLMSEVRTLRKLNPKESGFIAQPSGDNLYEWNIRWHGFDHNTAFGTDMTEYECQTGKNYVELKMTFPSDFPNSPPFLRVIQPRFAFRTGHVTVGGSVCNEILTSQGWRSDFQIDGMLVTVFAGILNGAPRLERSSMTVPYSINEAISAFKRMSQVHGWGINSWFPNN